MDYRYDDNGEPIAACDASARLDYRDHEELRDTGLWLLCDHCHYERFVGTLAGRDTVPMIFMYQCADDHDFNHSSLHRARVAA